MADFDRIKRNVKKLIDAKAPDKAISSYLSDEGVTRDDLVISNIDFDRPVEAVRADIGKLKGSTRKKALDTWASRYVEKERESGGVGQYASDVMRNLIRGTPIGSIVDEGSAAFAAGRNALGLGGAPYDEALAYERATNRAVDADSTKLGSLPLIGDVTVGGVQKLAGGVASAPFAPIARVMQGGTMLPRMVNAGVTGAGYGAAYGYGAGEGETDQEGVVNRLISGGVGGVVGGGIGTAAVPVAAGVGRVLQGPPRPQGVLRNYDRRAVANITDDMINDALPVMQNPRGPTGATEDITTLADLGDNLRGHAGAIARMPGPGKSLVINTLGRDVRSGRRGGAPARITQTLDDNIGPAQNMVERTRAEVAQANRAARPLYQEFEQMQLANTPAMQRVLQRAEGAPGVMQQAARLMQLEGYDPGGRLTGRLLDYIRRGVDDLARNAERGTNERRLYEQLARQINGTVDAQLRAISRARTGQDVSIYQQARDTAAGGQQFRAGAEAGADVFKRGTHPDQMAADVARMRPQEQQGYGFAARNALRDIMGRAPIGDTAVKRELGSDFAQQKLGQIPGVTPQNARNILDRIDLENQYESTRQAAVGNSVTSTMQQNLRRYNQMDQQRLPGAPTNLWTDIKRIASVITNRLTRGATAEAQERVAYDAARILMAQGYQRDQIIRALAEFVNDATQTAQQRSALERVLSSMMQGSRQTAIAQTAQGGGQTP